MKNNLIEIWYADMESSELDCQENWKLLGVDEQYRAEKFTNVKQQKNYVNGQAMVRILLARYAKIKPQEIMFGKGDYGKPYLISDRSIDFNLSHSGTKLAVAVGYQCPLGVDIEIWKHRVHLSGLVKKCFADQERIYWESLPEEQKSQAFHDFWTKKESFVKAVGRGIAMGMNRCVISPENPTRFLSIPDVYGSQDDWKVIALNLGEGISGALSLPNRSCKIKIRNFQSWSKCYNSLHFKETLCGR